MKPPKRQVDSQPDKNFIFRNSIQTPGILGQNLVFATQGNIPCESSIKNAIGKPYEREVHLRFDEGGADSSNIIIFNQTLIDRAIRLYATKRKILTVEINVMTL